MSQPKIHLSEQFSIGYKQPLATTSDAISLGEGNHYLLARNGRGKTTLLKTLAGNLKSKGGAFEIQGKLQFVNEFLDFDRELTPASIFKALVPKKRRAEALAMAEKVELDVKKPFGHLSRGNRQKTILIMAECRTSPSIQNIMLLDEPFTGLDAFTQQFFLKHWQNDTANTLRLITCHPDSDEMQFPSVVTISDSKLTHLTNEQSHRWSSLKGQLN